MVLENIFCISSYNNVYFTEVDELNNYQVSRHDGS